MIYEADLDEAIAECIGIRKPDAQTCIKLAAFYTIKQHLYGKSEQDEVPISSVQKYSYSSGEDTISYESDTEFGSAVHGLENGRIMPLIDELVDTIRVINPRLYNAFMQRIKNA